MRWSPTRSALAIMVSDGLTAVLDTKKLPSTTYRLSKSYALQFTSSADVLGSCPNLVGQCVSTVGQGQVGQGQVGQGQVLQYNIAKSNGGKENGRKSV